MAEYKIVERGSPHSHKPGPLKGVPKEERLERYSVIMNFVDEQDIDTKILVNQWNADQRGVAHARETWSHIVLD